MKTLLGLFVIAVLSVSCAGLRPQEGDRPVVIQPVPMPPAEDGSTPEGSAVGVDLGSDRWNRIFELGLAVLGSFLLVNNHRDRKAAKKASV
jgi:hypothetical protein